MLETEASTPGSVRNRAPRESWGRRAKGGRQCSSLGEASVSSSELGQRGLGCPAPKWVTLGSMLVMRAPELEKVGGQPGKCCGSPSWDQLQHLKEGSMSVVQTEIQTSALTDYLGDSK